MHDEAAGVIHTKPTWTKYEALSSKGKSSTDTQRAEGHTRRIMEQLGSMAFVQEFQALSSMLRDPDEVCMSRPLGIVGLVPAGQVHISSAWYHGVFFTVLRSR